MSNQKRFYLFEVAVLMHPTKKEFDAGEKAELVVKPKCLVAKDSEQANQLAVFEVPEKYRDKMDQIEVLVRPFV